MSENFLTLKESLCIAHSILGQLWRTRSFSFSKPISWTPKVTCNISYFVFNQLGWLSFILMYLLIIERFLSRRLIIEGYFLYKMSWFFKVHEASPLVVIIKTVVALCVLIFLQIHQSLPFWPNSKARKRN